MSLLVDLALVAVAVVALALGARWLVGAAAALAAAANVPPLVVGLTVVAFGTSAPEFAVSVDAALAGRPDVAVGNVVGSNVFNVGFLLGVLALLRPFRVTDALVRRDALAMGAATAVALAVLADLTVSRVEGALLVSLLVAYLVALGVAARATARDSGADGGAGPVEPPIPETGRERPLAVEAGVLLVGLALVAAGGDLLVGAAGRLAADAVLGLGWLLVLTAVATALLATGRRLTRPEGAALVATVVAYWVVTAG